MAMKELSEQDMRERFEALKQMTIDEFCKEEKQEASTLKLGKETRAAFEAAEARAKGKRDATAKAIEVGFDLVCEFFIDIHRLASYATRHSTM